MTTLQEAFDEYLDESANDYVDRDQPQLIEVIAGFATSTLSPRLHIPFGSRAASTRFCPICTSASNRD
jgi:hypothetical protein